MPLEKLVNHNVCVHRPIRAAEARDRVRAIGRHGRTEDLARVKRVVQPEFGDEARNLAALAALPQLLRRRERRRPN